MTNDQSLYLAKMDNMSNKLRETVVIATKHLKKMPGSSLPNCNVRADDLLIYYNRKMDAIWVDFSQEERFNLPLLQLRGKEFVKIASYIPDLIKKAKDLEPLIRDLADEATAAIHKAIEDSYEYH